MRMLDGWLTIMHRCILLLTTVYLCGVFHTIANGYSSMATALAFAKEIQTRGRYCMWTNYNRSLLNFKEQNVPIAFIFTIDHNLAPHELKSVLDMYHALACLLPDDSERLYAVVMHLPKNPKLYYGKLQNIHKLHRSFEEADDTTSDSVATNDNPCNLVQQAISLLREWLSKAFFFEKVIKHIVLINDRIDKCVIPSHFRGLYYKEGKPHRWFVDKIILNVPHIEPFPYRLDRSGDVGVKLKGSMDRSVIEGTRLWLSTSLNQQNYDSFNETILKKSLTNFLHEILLESVVADAVFSLGLKNKWIKYDLNDFKRQSIPSRAFESWAWLLNFLRIMFFIVGTFILLITTCALCGFACMLSSVVRDDYYNRRQIQQREEEFRNLEERFREAGIDYQLNPFAHREWEREDNDELHTAIERLSVVSEVDDTQVSSIPDNDTYLSTGWPAQSHERSLLNDDEVLTILGTARSRTELHSAADAEMDV